MRFPGWLKIQFHPDVNLLRSALEPAASARAQDWRLFNFLHPHVRAVELSSRCFASRGTGELNVIDARHAGLHTDQNSMPQKTNFSPQAPGASASYSSKRGEGQPNCRVYQTLRQPLAGAQLLTLTIPGRNDSWATSCSAGIRVSLRRAARVPRLVE